MVVIKVRSEDEERVFEILANNGKFMGLSENRFNIIEHPEEVLERIKDAGIKPEILE